MGRKATYDLKFKQDVAKYFKNHTASEVIEKFKVSKSSVSKWFIQLGNRRKRKPMTDEEKKIITDSYKQGISTWKIAWAIDRSPKSVGEFAFKQGLTRKIRRWTPEDDEFIKKYYNGMNAEEIANQIGRTYNAVLQRAVCIGCTFPERRRSRGGIKKNDLRKQINMTPWK